MEGRGRCCAPHLIKDGGIASCCGNPHLLEEFVTDGILVFRIEIGAAKDNPEKTKGRMLTEAEALGTPLLVSARRQEVFLGLAKPCVLPAPSHSHPL